MARLSRHGVGAKLGEAKRAPQPGPPVEGTSIGQLTSEIKNKIIRSKTYNKLKSIKKKEVKKLRTRRRQEDAKSAELGQEPPKRVPRTIENTREKDPTIVGADDMDVVEEEQQDEFAAHFRSERPPNVLMTTSYKATAASYRFCADMLNVFPCCTFYKRQGCPLKKMVAHAIEQGFTDVVVVNEDSKKVNSLIVCHLPSGPTAHFKLSSLVLTKDIKGHGKATTHKPELVLNNFSTRLGMRVGRMFGSLFCQNPTFSGRRVITFHNQRDFIFFRHHRYIFDEVLEGPSKSVRGNIKQDQASCLPVKTRLQELGPRFTLKLVSLQQGTFDSKCGEYEWIHKRGEMDISRRKFHL